MLLKEINIFESLNHIDLTRNLEKQKIILIKKLMAQERDYLMFCENVFKKNLTRLETITNHRLASELISLHNWMKEEIKLCKEIILSSKDLTDLIKKREEKIKLLEDYLDYIKRTEIKEIKFENENTIRADFLKEESAQYVLVKLGYFIKFVLDVEHIEEVKYKRVG